jgi:AraC-like DNA-binding protein
VDYYLFIQSVVTFVESRIRSDICYMELERATGFSYRHIRETFRSCTRHTLARYISGRKIANAAFEAVHTNKSLTEIAGEYGFETYDTFTRAFKRETGVTPANFRRMKFVVGRRMLVTGAFAPVIKRDGNKKLAVSEFLEVEEKMKSMVKSKESCILYGVPKVQYTHEECTPFPSALKACLNYMGQEIDYTFLMAASGAAFRLRWNPNFWNGGNVDIMNIYENPMEAFARSFTAAGRKYQILERKNGAGKEDFIRFIKEEIDEGRPVIALGIIGPPEACIVTGYKENGNVLLGWNFFQTNPEFAKDVEFDESGYFICKNWWENECTLAVMSFGEEQTVNISQKVILENAIEILTKEQIGNCKGGQAAYDAWAKAIGDDREFPKDAVLPMLLERIMCQGDAQVMVGEGRSYAACFMDWVACTNEAAADKSREAAGYFRAAAADTHKMSVSNSWWGSDESMIRKFAEPETRRMIVSHILEAKQNEAKACEILKDIVQML